MEEEDDDDAGGALLDAEGAAHPPVATGALPFALPGCVCAAGLQARNARSGSPRRRREDRSTWLGWTKGRARSFIASVIAFLGRMPHMDHDDGDGSQPASSALVSSAWKDRAVGGDGARHIVSRREVADRDAHTARRVLRPDHREQDG